MMIKPVKRIPLSHRDRQHLGEQGKKVRENEQPETYRDRVVLKPWGHEFLMFENEDVAAWFLHIKKDHSTSMHCHPRKRTSLTLLSGKALCNTFRHRNFMSAGDSLIIDAAVFHSTKALSLDGIYLIEVETPPAKLDLCRLEDSYGRSDCGYEGSSRMVTENLDSFNFIFWDKDDCNGKNFSMNGKCFVTMEAYSSNELFQRFFRLDPGALYCVCKGALWGKDKSKIVNLGETERGGYLQQVSGLQIEADTLLMKFTVFD